MQDEEDDEVVAEGEADVVPFPHVRLQAVGERLHHAAEVHHLAQHVGHDGVGAVDLEPGKAAVPAPDIHHPIEQGHQRPAPSAGNQYHAGGPQVLVHRSVHAVDIACKQQEGCRGEEVQGCGVAARGAALYHMSGQGAKHDGGAEGEAAPHPGVGVPWGEVPLALLVPPYPVAPATQDKAVHRLGKVALGRVVAAEVHGQPVDEHQQAGGRHLCAQAEVQHQHGGYEVARGDGLERIAVEAQIVRVKAKEIALHHHAENKEDDKPLQYLPVHRPLVGSALVLRESKRHGRTGHEQEQGHDHVPQMEALPVGMGEPSAQGLQPWGGAVAAHLHQHGLEEDEEEEVEATEYVQGLEALKWLLHNDMTLSL